MKVTIFQQALSALIFLGGIIAGGSAYSQVVFQENFDGLTLGPFVSTSEIGGDGTDWTDVPPVGWTRDNTTTPVGGPAEFFGFTFLDLASWDATAAQDRGDFSFASGTVMVADGDEYDDDAGNGNVLGTGDGMNVFMQTPATNFTAGPGKLKLNWSNDFRAFDASRATIEVSYDGGGSFTETAYDITGTDDRNSPKSVGLNNPSSGSLVLKFGYTEADNDWWWAVDNIVVSEQVLLPVLNASVDRTDGSVILQNQTGSSVNISGYQITSAFEALNPVPWQSIADNYDANSGSAVDGTNVWTELTQAGVHGDLSEGELTTGTGGSLADSQTINLGNSGTWIRNPNEDLVFEYISGGNVVTGLVNFVNGVPYANGDLNADGVVNASDWAIFRSNQHTDLSGISLAEAYRLGDLTGNGENTHADFAAFKNAFDARNGGGAFQAMVSAAVPEPTCIVSLLTGGILILSRTRRER